MAASDVQINIDIIAEGMKKLDDIAGKIDKLGNSADDADTKTKKFGGGLGNAGLAAAAGAATLAIGFAADKVGDFVKASIDAAARTEGLRNGLKTVIPDADEFEKTLARIDKQARLPGLQKNDLVSFTTSLTAAGLKGDQVESALTILGSRMVGFGQTSAEAAGVVAQFTQAMNRGKIEGDELNRLFETLPGFKNIVTEMTGVTGGAQDLNAHFDKLGLSVQDGMIPLLEEYDKSLGAINHDSALVKADAFDGALEDLQNTIGQKLLPVYKNLLDTGANLLDGISGLLSGTQPLPKVFDDLATAQRGMMTALSPLLEPLKDLGDAVLPLLKTLWNELMGIFIDVVIPTWTKITEVLAPVIGKLIELGTPIANLINTWLPPLVSLLKGVASIVIDIVLVPLQQLAGAFGWVIEKITSLINLIPGAKVEMDNQAEAHQKVTDKANAEATAIDAVTTATEAQTTESQNNKTAADEQATALESVKNKQVDLKVAVVEANLELKAAKTALKEATTPDEIEAASVRITTAIGNVKAAKIAEAQTFDDESKKQIAILKAEATAAADNETAVKTASKNKEKYAEELTTKEETAAADRELALSNEVAAASSALTNLTNNSEVSFNKRVEAFRTYKDDRKALSDEVVANINASAMTEAEKAQAIREEHEALSEDLATEWGKITEAEKTELEAQKKKAEAEAKAKAQAIKEANEAILAETEAHLISAESAYKNSSDTTQEQQDTAFENMITALKTHNEAELKALEDSGEDTQVERAKQNAAIDKLINSHNKAKLKKQQDAAKAEAKAQKKADTEAEKAQKKENKEKLALLKFHVDDKKDVYDQSWEDQSIDQQAAFRELEIAVSEHYDELIRQAETNGDDITLLENEKNAELRKLNRTHHEKVQADNEKFNKELEKGWEDWKGMAKDAVGEVVELFKDYLAARAETTQIEIEGEEKKREVFKELSDEYFEFEKEAQEKLKELAEERIRLYEQVHADVQAELANHTQRVEDIEERHEQRLQDIEKEHTQKLLDIDKDYKESVIEINENMVFDLAHIGVESHRDRLDDAIDFYDELESIESEAQKKREAAAKEHSQILADIEKQRQDELHDASRAFFSDVMGAFDLLGADLADEEISDDVAYFNLKGRLSGDFQSLVSDLLGAEAGDFYSLEGFDLYDFLGIDPSTFKTTQQFVRGVKNAIPGVIERLRSGEALTDMDRQAQQFAQSLAGMQIGVTDTTTGILGGAAGDIADEQARYLEALDAIDQWEIAAQQVVLNAENLMIGAGLTRDTAITQAGTDRTEARVESFGIRADEIEASKKVRDAATQYLAETYNNAMAAITFDEIEISQSIQTAMDRFFEDYANAAMSIDVETKLAMQEHMKEASKDFWGGVMKIGGQVLGAGAGLALSAATGGVVPPTLAMSFGAKLGGMGGDALAGAVLDEKEFHFDETDRVAQIAGSQTAAAVMGSPSPVQLQNAADFSNFFGTGFIDTARGMMQGAGPTTIHITIDNSEEFSDEKIRKITKRQVEIDQQLTNYNI